MTRADTILKRRGRRITFEYSLVAGVNDSREDALELAGRLKGLNCHVNLIPVNPVRDEKFCAFRQGSSGEFQNKS